MYTIVALIVFLLLILFVYILISVFKHQIQFIIAGLDTGFSISDLILLWKVAQICELSEPKSLFFSINALKDCMAKLSSMSAADSSDSKLQKVLSKLFDYRTKVQNESDNKKSLESTMFLDAGQKLRIILPGKGVFTSEILNCGKELILSIPKQHNLIPIPGPEWVGKVLNVYLWRSGDARYVFDTTVTGQGLFLGKSSITIKHSNNLVRTQKRKSVRVKCKIYGMLYIIKATPVDYFSVETKNGYKCLIEDISESGALIRIGGKGVQNIKIKLQFNINNKLIVMFGDIKTIEYNENENQTLIHFECTHIDAAMKNDVLRYVYDIMPQSEREILEAMSDKDDEEEENSENPSENKDSENTEDVNSELKTPDSGDVNDVDFNNISSNNNSFTNSSGNSQDNSINNTQSDSDLHEDSDINKAEDDMVDESMNIFGN